jgi:hypothetical protein
MRAKPGDRAFHDALTASASRREPRGVVFRRGTPIVLASDTSVAPFAVESALAFHEPLPPPKAAEIAPARALVKGTRASSIRGAFLRQALRARRASARASKRSSIARAFT